jgi:Tfp pilus assembly protein FimT
MTVVVASMVLLAVIGLPAIRAFIHSFETEGSAKNMISGALASARAIAAQNQKYAGIRFQQDTGGHQYMIFIIQDPDMMAWGFRAVPGLKPIKLPDSVGVMDLTVVERVYKGRTNLQLTDKIVSGNDMISSDRDLTDTTAFSIVFSSSGKMVIHEVWLRNRNGIPDSMGEISRSSTDDVFNKKAEVDTGTGMFYQDDYFNAWWSLYPGLDLGLGPEYSRNRFVIYDRKEFTQAYQKGQAWTGYLTQIKPIYINPYTGTIISE